MKFVPLYDRILIEMIYADDVTPGGLIIPEQAKEKPMRGRIVAVGKGGYLENGTFRETQVEIGDIVLFGKFAGSTISMDGKEYLILVEADLFGKEA